MNPNQAIEIVKMCVAWVPEGGRNDMAYFGVFRLVDGTLAVNAIRPRGCFFQHVNRAIWTSRGRDPISAEEAMERLLKDFRKDGIQTILLNDDEIKSMRWPPLPIIHRSKKEYRAFERAFESTRLLGMAFYVRFGETIDRHEIKFFTNKGEAEFLIWLSSIENGEPLQHQFVAVLDINQYERARKNLHEYMLGAGFKYMDIEAAERERREGVGD